MGERCETGTQHSEQEKFEPRPPFPHFRCPPHGWSDGDVFFVSLSSFPPSLLVRSLDVQPAHHYGRHADSIHSAARLLLKLDVATDTHEDQVKSTNMYMHACLYRAANGRPRSGQVVRCERTRYCALGGYVCTQDYPAKIQIIARSWEQN